MPFFFWHVELDDTNIPFVVIRFLYVVIRYKRFVVIRFLH